MKATKFISCVKVNLFLMVVGIIFILHFIVYRLKLARKNVLLQSLISITKLIYVNDIKLNFIKLKLHTSLIRTE